MTRDRYDMLVIGSGPAGQRAAIQATKLGRSVGIVEKREVVGGVCTNTGTIPSKTLREAVLYLTGHGQHAIYGASYAVKDRITMDDLMVRTSYVIKREIDITLSQMRRNGIDVIPGEAVFASPHTLEIRDGEETSTVEADVIVIAVGSRPTPPPGERTFSRMIDSDGILLMKALPKTMIVVGAGVIGLEYASIFATLGVEITLVDKRERLLPFVDAEIIEALSYHLRQNSTTMRLGEEVLSLSEGPDGKAVAELASGKRITADMLLFSAGRVGATDTLHLEVAGLTADERGRLRVDEGYRTEVPHIYAVGDVIGFPSLASTSMTQGRIAAAHAFGKSVAPMSSLFPFGIYTIPEISMVGPTEEELTDRGVPYEVGVSRYREIARGQMLGDDTGMLKLLFHTETRRLLAAHAIGTGSTEMIHIAQAVVVLGGTLDYFLDNVFNYPTLAECYKVAALDCANKLT